MAQGRQNLCVHAVPRLRASWGCEDEDVAAPRQVPQTGLVPQGHGLAGAAMVGQVDPQATEATGDFLAEAAKPENPHCLPYQPRAQRHLGAAPLPGPNVLICRRNPVQQGERQTERELGHRSLEHPWRVRHQDALVPRQLDGDLVVAHAVGDDHPKMRQQPEHRLRNIAVASGDDAAYTATQAAASLHHRPIMALKPGIDHFLHEGRKQADLQKIRSHQAFTSWPWRPSGHRRAPARWVPA